ncbi:uncharacterized protein UBRO2_05850 [Ustilago bromivora]|uniref:Uncharacterized protein n=1 Tax=Ustilago bromivora TaxID=307758 RepID=A0A8H8TWD1_9BASI|nr:uncharacterized protein UBRO2_05850 [Ustilago bromivora]
MPYQLRSQSVSGAPPTKPDPSLPKHRRIILWLKPHDTSVPEVDLPPSPADPAPLEPLFLGLDPKMGSFSGDDDEIGSPNPTITPALEPAGSGPSGQDYSLTLPPQDLYDIDSRRPPLDLSTPKQQAAWEAELACSPTPPPTTNKVVDMPHESVTEPGSPPDSINLWVEPMVEELWTCTALAAPGVPSSYVNM